MSNHRSLASLLAISTVCVLSAGCAGIGRYEATGWRPLPTGGVAKVPSPDEPEPAPPRAATRTPGITQATGVAPRDLDLLPPDAKPGECYARVYVPPVYRTVTERVLVQQSARRVETTPARYEVVEEQVMVEGPSERIEVVPAEYDWVEEQVVVTPASTREERLPAVHDWVEEKVMVTPAHTIWKRGRGPIEKVDNATGEIMCLIEQPAVYETVRKQVLKQPATVRVVQVPAEFEKVRKKVMVQPPSTRKVAIPAKYDTVKVRKMAEPARTKETTTPADYKTVSKSVLMSEGRVEWKRVLCETNLKGDVIRKLQQSLLDAGHDPGPIDGLIGTKTRAALSAFQVEKELAVGGITYETLRALAITVD